MPAMAVPELVRTPDGKEGQNRSLRKQVPQKVAFKIEYRSIRRRRVQLHHFSQFELDPLIYSLLTVFPFIYRKHSTELMGTVEEFFFPFLILTDTC